MARLVVRLEEASSANALMEQGLQALLKGASEAKATRDLMVMDMQALAQKQVGPLTNDRNSCRFVHFHGKSFCDRPCWYAFISCCEYEQPYLHTSYPEYSTLYSPDSPHFVSLILLLWHIFISLYYYAFHPLR